MKFRGGEFSTGTMRNFQPELTTNSFQCRMGDKHGPVAQRLEQRTHKRRSRTSNKRDS